MNPATNGLSVSSSPDTLPASTAGESPAGSPADASPATAAAPVPPRRGRMQYFAAFRYVFQSPEWPQSLALGSVCYFIPVFGQVALLGYYYEIVERLHRDPQALCPTFNFRRFATYAGRGVWSYLLILAISSVLQPALQIPLQYTIFGIMIAFQSSQTTGAIVAAIAAVAWLLIAAVVMLVMMYVVQPLMLRGGLSQDLGLMFRARWVVQYVKRVWLEILLVQLVVLVAMFLLLPLGALMFCIGLLPVSMWLAIAGSHLAWQVYELALERGCEAVPLKPREADEPPRMAVPPPTKASATAPADHPTSPNSSASP